MQYHYPPPTAYPTINSMIRLCTMPKAQLDPEDPAKGLTDPEGPAEIQPDPEDPVPATKQSHGGSCKIAVVRIYLPLDAVWD